MSYLPIAALILSGSSMLAGPGVSAVGPPVAQPETARSSIEATRLLEEVRSISNQLNREVQTLESFSRNGVSWEGHAYQLTLAKDHINAIGDRLETLQAIRSTAAPWQQQAIDSLVPVAVQLASRTETAINHLNENRRQLFNPVYTDHLTSIADHADELRDSVAVSLEVANTQDKLDTLRERAAELQS
jgi:uncharacterized protein YhaN